MVDKSKIPEDFLLNPELINEFLGMFESKILFYQGELEKTDNVRKQLNENISQLKEKQGIMMNYLKFIKEKGFGYMKQAADEHFKNVKEADSNRVVEYCGLPYMFMNKSWNCMRSPGHDGDCGIS